MHSSSHISHPISYIISFGFLMLTSVFCVFAAFVLNYHTSILACKLKPHTLPFDFLIICVRTGQIKIISYGHIMQPGTVVTFFDKDKLITDPMCSALGYGMEYTYSVMERIRLAGLAQNDATMQPPILGDVGMYVWKVKETVASETDVPEWGTLEERSIAWETVTATSLILSGANLLIMRHPRAIENVGKTIDELV